MNRNGVLGRGREWLGREKDRPVVPRDDHLLVFCVQKLNEFHVHRNACLGNGAFIEIFVDLIHHASACGKEGHAFCVGGEYVGIAVPAHGFVTAVGRDEILEGIIEYTIKETPQDKKEFFENMGWIVSLSVNKFKGYNNAKK